MVSMVAVTKEDWTFRDISTKEYTHGFHQYPARMHPEIAKRLIVKYAIKSSDIVFDPFMGSGGVLVESMLHGNNSVGIDLNPFAVLLINFCKDSKKIQNCKLYCSCCRRIDRRVCGMDKRISWRR